MSDLFCGSLNIQSLGGQGLPGALPDPLPATKVDYGPNGCVPSSITTVDAFLSWLEANFICLFDVDAIKAASIGEILQWDGSQVSVTGLGSTLASLIDGASLGDLIWFDGTGFVTGSFIDYLSVGLGACSNGQVLGCSEGQWGAITLAFEQLSNVAGTGNLNDLYYWNGAKVTPIRFKDYLSVVLGACCDGKVLGCTPTGWGLTDIAFTDLVDTCSSLGIPGQVVTVLPGVDGPKLCPAPLADAFDVAFGECTDECAAQGKIIRCTEDGWGGGTLAFTELNDTADELGEQGQLYWNAGGVVAPVDLQSLMTYVFGECCEGYFLGCVDGQWGKQEIIVDGGDFSSEIFCSEAIAMDALPLDVSALPTLPTALDPQAFEDLICVTNDALDSLPVDLSSLPVL